MIPLFIEAALLCLAGFAAGAMAGYALVLRRRRRWDEEGRG